MSATGRDAGGGYERDPEDYYRTPAWAVRTIHPWLPPAVEGIRVLDAGSGDGAIADALPYGKRTKCVELNRHRAEACIAKGYNTDPRSFFDVPPMQVDVVVMNPPYGLAMKFVSHALDFANGGGCVFALLRLPWLASLERAAFHRTYPAHVLVLPRRPAFCMACSCGAKPKCGWGEVRAVEDPRPPKCPGCGGPVKVSTTDATDYAWFGWGDNKGAARNLHAGSWNVLEVESS